MSRKPVPDNLNKTVNVMDALQNIKTNKPLEEDKPLVKTVEKGSEVKPKTENLQTEKVEKSETKRAVPKDAPAKSEKLKVNLYLSEEIKEKTEDTQGDLRKIFRRDEKGKINQSLIVETALRIVLGEFDRLGENSSLVKEIKQQLQKNK